MQHSIVISGFGGQGTLFAGQVLAYAALKRGLHITWFPSYGPEMRGGTAHCVVIVSDEEIGSPVVARPEAAIAMNLPSLDKYEGLVQPGGLLVVNASLVDREPRRSDIGIVMVPAGEIAEALGDKRMANMVLLGALLARLELVPLEAIAQTLEDKLPERRRHLLKANLGALKKGAEAANALLPA